MKNRLLVLLIVVVVIGAIVASVYFIARSQGCFNETPSTLAFCRVLNDGPAVIFEIRDDIRAWADENIVLVAVVFVVVYFIVVALSIPGATYLTLTGGFLFGSVGGTLLVNVGASTGAIAIFLAARYFLGDAVQNKYADKLKKFNHEMEENGWSYLITLRLIPLVPFFLINLFSGFTKVKVLTFAWTTVLGIIPGSFVYANIGNTAATFEQGQSVLSPQIIIAIVLLVALSLLPVIHKKIKNRNADTSASTDSNDQK